MNKSGQNINQPQSNGGSTNVSINNMFNRQMNNANNKAITPKNNMNI